MSHGSAGPNSPKNVAPKIWARKTETCRTRCTSSSSCMVWRAWHRRRRSSATVLIRCLFADPRSEDWLLCSSPFVPLGIVAVYLLFVKKWGPSFMANRSAYRIEPLIILYNCLQIMACLFIFYRVCADPKRKVYPSPAEYVVMICFACFVAGVTHVDKARIQVSLPAGRLYRFRR